MNNDTIPSFRGREQSTGLENQKVRLKIIICGGGLAGLASALLLREDHDVTILESSTLNEELGAAITLSMNASRLLRSSLARAGFDKDKAKYVEAEKLQEVHWQDLSILDELQMEHVTKVYNEPWWYFSRKDIHSELKRAALAEDGMGTTPALKLGAYVERVDPKHGTVHLASGETFHGDVIIGADGIRSASGNSVFGKLPSRSEELSAYRCMIPSTELKDDQDTAVLVDCAKVLIFIGPERRIVAYPCSSWDYMNFVCIFPESSGRRSQWNDKVLVQDMLDGFKDFHHSIKVKEPAKRWRMPKGSESSSKEPQRTMSRIV
ncbi:hypothetical protein Daus18300_010898 [Diaporthe australafricana]|uniref:FAD-binding domain-containing protein n=1 Tax=Diaporthe australafricana TaxID=127596 RepID=A0ABR3W8P6_9PEZI